MFNKHKAFTLAEVLITLVIIGVIAAMTVPSLMSNTNHEEILAKTKKAYSTLSQCVMRSKFDNGPIEEWYEIAEKKAPNYYNLFFKPYLSGSKNCLDYKSCGYKSVAPWKLLNGSTYDWHITNEGKSRFFFYMADGTFVAVQTGSYPCVKYDTSGKCIKSELAFASEPTVIMDVNGNRNPNIIGKDVFFLNFNNERGTVPYCNTKTASYVNNNCKRKGNGSCCLKKLIGDSWKYDENYPI